MTASRPFRPSTTAPKLTKEQMVREMREAAASTAKVKAPKTKKGLRRT